MSSLEILFLAAAGFAAGAINALAGAAPYSLFQR